MRDWLQMQYLNQTLFRVSHDLSDIGRDYENRFQVRDRVKQPNLYLLRSLEGTFDPLDTRGNICVERSALLNIKKSRIFVEAESPFQTIELGFFREGC